MALLNKRRNQMNIINDDRIFKKYFKAIENQFARKVEDITEITIHGAGVGSSASAIIKWMLDGGIMPDGSMREVQYKKGISLFHSEVERNGDIYNILNLLFWCYGSSCGKHDRFCINIELINGHSENKNAYSEDQYISLFEQIDAYKGLFPIKRITGHNYNARTYSGVIKTCPGNFDWDKLADSFKLKRIENDCYEF
jgi:N-acetyl-anhydromuramyl-L-alanine amidase AmpD